MAPESLNSDCDLDLIVEGEGELIAVCGELTEVQFNDYFLHLLLCKALSPPWPAVFT